MATLASRTAERVDHESGMGQLPGHPVGVSPVGVDGHGVRILEGDIKSCFDEISHPALMDRVQARVGDKRVLGLVKAFLVAGIPSEDGVVRDTKAGTPQGGILSPLLANIALSVLDEHFAEAWRTTVAADLDRARRRRNGEPMTDL